MVLDELLLNVPLAGEKGLEGVLSYSFLFTFILSSMMSLSHFILSFLGLGILFRKPGM